VLFQPQVRAQAGRGGRLALLRAGLRQTLVRSQLGEIRGSHLIQGGHFGFELGHFRVGPQRAVGKAADEYQQVAERGRAVGEHRARRGIA